MILLAALIYGSYFIVLKLASEEGFGPAAIMLYRGAVFLIVAAAFLGRGIVTMTRKDILFGSIIGILNFLGFFFQTVGSSHSTPSNNAFITCLNTVFVPFFAWLIYKKKPSWKVYVSLPVALIGMALLTGIFTTTFKIETGDTFSFLGAIVFAIVIVLLGNMAKKINLKKLLFIMAFWQTIGGFIMFGAQENFVMPPSINWLNFILIFLFLGLIASFAATTIQTYGQRFTSETSTVMILALESVFAFVLSIALGFDTFSLPLLFGGVLIIGAVVFLIADYSIFKQKSKQPLNDSNEIKDNLSSVESE